MYRTKAIFVFVLFFVLFISSSVLSDDSYKRWNTPRDYEPIILKGSDLPQLLTLPIPQLFVYAYNASVNSWQQIPFQFDQKDDSSHFWVPVPNNIFDLKDELVFMARDMGDRVSDGTVWIDDLDSRNYNRLEITVSDPLDGNKQAWAYVYRSTTLAIDPTLTSYMQYIPDPKGAGADTVKASTYIEGHNAAGIPDFWKLPAGSNVDILDRQKVRITLLLLGTFPVTVTEALLESTTPIIKYKTGPVRVLRETSWHVVITGYEPFDFDLPLQFFPFSTESGGISRNFKASDHVNLIRVSFDLTPAATGMKFYNRYNPNGLLINGTGGNDGINNKLDDSPVVNWYLVTGNQGSYSLIFRMTPLGDTRTIYYKDDSKTDGSDTGDKMSYGDIGIQATGKDIQGNIGFSYKAYYLGANKPYSLGESLSKNFETPTTIAKESQSFIPIYYASLSLPQTSAPELSTTVIPITIGDVTGFNVTAVNMSVTFNTSILDVMSASNEGTLSTLWNPPILMKTATGVDIALSGTTPLSGSGTLLNLLCKAIGEDGETTPLDFGSVVFTPANVLAVPTAGSFRVDPGLVTIKLPDTTGMSGTSITIPVTVSDVTNLEVTSVALVITYNQTVLDATSISTANTLASIWAPPTFYDQVGRAGIIMSGSTPLSGAGTVVYITFNIIGPDQATSPLQFLNAKFNNNSPLAIRQNGNFKVEGVIPVELVSFEAKVFKNQVRLTWSTASESNNYGFEIQRTIATEMNWEIIDFFEGHGTTTIPQIYSFVDRDLASGVYLYRLKQIDFNGAFEFSHTIEVTVTAPSYFALGQNYPNPFNPVTTIEYQIPETVTDDVVVHLTIYNLLGVTLRTLVSKKQAPGFYRVSWDGKDERGVAVPTGTFIYQLRAGDYIATRRMVLIK